MNTETVPLAEILGALSHALDLTEGQPKGHTLRCCWIGMHAGRRLDLDAEAQGDLFYTLLLKDAGCSSNAGRLFELYGTDDLAAKRDAKTVDVTNLFAVAKYVLAHVPKDAPLRERVQRISRLARDGQDLITELVATRCERGAEIARQLGFSDRVAAGVHSLDEHWNGNGKPARLRGRLIPIESRVALVAQVAEVFHAVGGPERAVSEVRGRAGSWFDPDVAAAFQLASSEDGFWQGLEEPGLAARVSALEPEERSIVADDSRIDVVAEAFARVVDAKSPFTYGHSTRVATVADGIASELGLEAPRRRTLHRAALLHDIGKLAVSNAILDKPEPLSNEEWEKVRAHPVHSREVLERTRVFRPWALMAAAHHERPDGKGYPWGIGGDDLSMDSRILGVADVYDALTAERPYRGPIPVKKSLEIMAKDRGPGLDPEALDALVRAVG